MQCLPLLTDQVLSLHKEFQLLPYLLSIMFLGYFYRKLYDDKKNNRKLNKTLFCFSLIATFMCLGLPIFLLVSSLMGYELVEHSFRFGTGHTFGFILFFTGLFFLKNAPKLLLWFGGISYSLYLFHPIVMRVVSQITSENKFLQGYHLSFYMIVSALISIFLAYLVYSWVEKPAIKLGHNFTNEK